MKIILLSILFVGFSVNAQKVDEVYFNQLKEIEHTNFVVTYSRSISKMGNVGEDKLVFINTESNSTKEIAFESGLNISNVTAKFDTKSSMKYQNANFILVETDSKAEKTYNKMSNTIRQLYLIKLNTFETVKLSSANFSLVNWVINEKTETLVIIESEIGTRNSSVQKIVTIPLKTGLAEQVYKIN